MNNTYYVYTYFDPRDASPIYVGLGRGKRAFKHWKKGANNQFFQNVLDKIRLVGLTPRIEFVAIDLSKEEAKTLEIQLIKLYGRRDLDSGTLCNLTDGGDGVKNYKMHGYHKEALEKGRQKYWESTDRIEHGRKISQVFSSRTQEELQVVSDNIKKSRTPSVKVAIGIASKERMNKPAEKAAAIERLQSEEAKAKRRITMKKTSSTAEKRKEKKDLTTSLWENQEYAARVSEGLKRSWAKRKEAKLLLTMSKLFKEKDNASMVG
jgi:hypothetical protein